MLLINNLKDFEKYILVDSDFDDERLLIFSKKAERKIKNLIGKEQYEVFLNMTTEDEVKDLLCSAVAQLGLLLAMPAINIRIATSGVFTSDSSNTKDPEWWKVRDLHNNLREDAFSCIDEALKEMELNPATYDKFIKSDNYTVIKELIVTNASDFNRYFNINNSRLTYLGLTPFIRECIDEYVRGWLGNCLNDIPATIKGKELLELLKKALVALTVAKAAETGSFSFLNNTLVVKWEQMPWEKSEKVTDKQLDKLMNSRLEAGMNYLTQAKNLIKENPTDFPCYVEDNKRSSLILKKKSGLFLG